MIDQAIGNALKELRAERDRLDAERERVDAAITALESATGQAAPRKRGRPAKKTTSKAAGRKKATGRAPRGLLKRTLHQILGPAKAPLTASVIRDKVAATGYPHSNPTNLYVSVYQALGNDPAVRKKGTGYSLNGRAAVSGGSKKKTKAKKKGKRKAKKRKTTAKKAGRNAKKKTSTKAA